MVSVGRSQAFLLVVPFTCLGGCADRAPQEPDQEISSEEERAGARAGGAEAIMNSDARSAGYLLDPGDFGKFQPGRLLEEVLEDVQWRGNLEMAAEIDGKRLTAISFGVFGGPFGDDARGDIVWAIFIDGTFDRFVRWPDWGEGPIKVGDFSRLARALEMEPVSLPELENVEGAGPAPASQTDPGLTAAWLRLRKPVEAAHRRDLSRNAELRDQFNASRLKIGMTQAEVESVLRADPIETGDVEAGPYRLFGGTETLSVMEYLHYANILTLFRDGRLAGIYSGYMVPGGERGIRSLREPVMVHGLTRQSFVDLPSPGANRRQAD
jgi:hypothetical protein